MSIDIRMQQMIPYQLSSMWEFYISDRGILKFFVVNTSLPFKKFNTETRTFGMKYYSSFVPEEDFSITFRETSRWYVYEYMTDWLNSVYDPVNKVFKTGPGKTKTAILAFERTESPLTTTYNKVFQFNNLRIKGIDDVSLDYTGAEALQLTVQFAVDEVVPGAIDTTIWQRLAAGVGSVLF